MKPSLTELRRQNFDPESLGPSDQPGVVDLIVQEFAEWFAVNTDEAIRKVTELEGERPSNDDLKEHLVPVGNIGTIKEAKRGYYWKGQLIHEFSWACDLQSEN